MRVATGNQEHGTDHPVDEKAHGRGLSQTSKSARLDFHGLRRNSHEVKMKIACARLMKAGITSNIDAFPLVTNEGLFRFISH
jgi:hypothetical protein